MHRYLLGLSVSLLLTVNVAMASSGTQAGSIHWVDWSDQVFQQAKQENRLVVLDLEAVWCHWCHVMDQQTYANPKVIQQIKDHYIAVRVDQDSRPDLANRYLEYGWPATIFFNAKGEELVKRAGYIPPDKMNNLLKAIVADPTPEKVEESNLDSPIEYSSTPFLTDTLRQELEKENLASYDPKNKGWGLNGHKFLDWDSVEYAISKAKKGDKQAEQMAKETLNASLNLIDPVWGGIYQYSTGGTWEHPHYEKIMSMQAENMRIYSEAYQLWGDPAYLKAATDIHRFLRDFLTSPEGAFYTSQDADLIQGEHSGEYFALDDAGRRKLGIPRVDKHQYARENGWAINALVSLYSATGDMMYLDEASKAADWVIANRSLPNGGFRHDEADVAGPYLGDTLGMGRAFLSLYSATGKREWLERSEQSMSFIAQHFKDPSGNPGFVSAEVKGDVTVAKPLPLRDENVMMARTANLLFHETADPQYRALAENAMRYIASPDIARTYFVGSALLSDMELSTEPIHITVVGHKDAPEAQALYQAALRYPAPYKRLDWWDKREGPLPNPDVQYPEMEKAAAFICTDKRCSLPVYNPEALASLVDRLSK